MTFPATPPVEKLPQAIFGPKGVGGSFLLVPNYQAEIANF